MRQGQQNRRGRGRNNNNNNNNNRKSQNPLMRSFESSGPDVKIRGTPSHIAEKYITLARDALSSGDPVLAENYLQHAEHYNRIILSYREQIAQQGGVDPMGNGAARTHSLAGPEGSDGDEFGEEEGDEFAAQPQLGGQGGQQPDLQQPPFPQQQRNFDNQNRFENRQPRHERFNNNRNDNRGDRGDQQRYDRNDRNDRQDFRGDRYERGDNRYRDDRRPHGGEGNHNQGEGGFRRRERYQGPNGNANGGDREGANGFPQPVVGAPQPVADRAERPERVERPERAERPDRAERPERVERAERPERAERAERPERAERAAPAAAPASIEQEQPAFLRRPVRRPRREEPAEAPVAPPTAANANEDQE